jgi:N-acetylglucosaminyl-diphospho-decaprenol L-rhamnosyltransferase
MSFTIVTVIHNSAPDLRRLLESIERHLDPRPQVIVVDSGSTDDGLEVAAAAGAQTVELDGNPGFGAASNAGVARADHDATVLLNPDVELLDGGLTALAARAAVRDVLLAPRLLNVDGSVQTSAWPVPGRWGALAWAALPGPLRPDGAGLAGWVLGAAIAARTKLLADLGPFDPDVFLFFEDLDLCLHAHERGVPVVLDPSVKVVHVGGHATGPAFGSEPIELQVRRRREVVGARLGARALTRDDAAQALTFTMRAWRARDRAYLRALIAQRRGATGRPTDPSDNRERETSRPR